MNNSFAIELWGCRNITISECNLSNNIFFGISQLESSYDCNITQNKILNNNEDGISIYDSFNSSISENNITNSCKNDRN